uniref:MFS transporter n=1 Tax=Catenulispora pinisilvae TaxID=2705253 RepID=UPI0018916D9E
VLTAGLVSVTGVWVLATGLAYCVYVLTGSTVASAVTVTATFVPQVFLGPLAGVFADRWDRKRTMVATNLLLAVGLAPLMLVRDRSQVWIVVAVLVYQGAVSQFFAPAEQAMLPRLLAEGEVVAEGELLTANTLLAQSRDLARLIGAALGGVLAAAGDIRALAVADAGSFAAAAAFIGFVRAGGRVQAAQHAQHTQHARRVADVVRELGAGLRLTLARRVLRVLMVFVLLTGIGEGVMGTLFAPFVRQVLHGDSRAYGLIAAVQAIGGILGGLAVAALGQRVPPARLLGFGALAFGAVDLAIFLYPLGYAAIWPAVLGMIVVGLPGALTVAGMYTLFQQHTADAFRGRAFGALTGVEGICQLVATLAAGYLAQAIGIVPVLVVQGLCYLAAGLTVLVAVRENDVQPRRPRNVRRRSATQA